MTRDQLCPRGYLRNDLADILRQPHDAPAVIDVDKRKTPGEEIIAKMDHVRGGEEDDGVAISMTVRVVNGANVLTVEMHRERIIKRNNRQRFLWRCRDRLLEQLEPLFARHPFAHVIVSDDRGFRTKRRVPAGVIAVPMRVEDEAQLALV